MEIRSKAVQNELQEPVDGGMIRLHHPNLKDNLRVGKRYHPNLKDNLRVGKRLGNDGPLARGQAQCSCPLMWTN